MTAKVIVAGEILVEIMARTPGDGFREPIDLVGPFPSGAPAIFADQLARLGTQTAMIGCVGGDDFGRVCLDRLSRDGVDVSAIRVDPVAVTGSAFVRYRLDGERDFIFSIAQSAAAKIELDETALASAQSATHLHVVGSSLGIPQVRSVVRELLKICERTGATISFDPNVRKELLAAREMRETLDEVLAATDLFLPSGNELSLFTQAGDDEAAAREVLARGVSAVVLKQGAKGARYFDASTDVSAPAYPVEEVDPTGAGDIFSATFVHGWLNGLPPTENLRRANAAGALAVTTLGPMEGGSTTEQIRQMMTAE